MTIKVFTPEQAETVRVEHLATVNDCRLLVAKFPGAIDKETTWRWLKRYLAEFAGTRVQDVSIEIGEHGKPFWPGRDIHFNLTHSDSWWALALRRNSAVGLDLEAWRERDRLAKIATRFFTRDENERLSRTFGDDDFIGTSLSMWTRKEARAKLRGGSVLEELSAAKSADLDPSIDLWTHVERGEFALSLAIAK